MENKNTVFCESCKESDCEISLDGDCNMIRAYKRYVYLRGDSAILDNETDKAMYSKGDK